MPYRELEQETVHLQLLVIGRYCVVLLLDSGVAMMGAFASGLLDLPDFYFTGADYRYRLDPEGKQRFLDLLREQFNSGVRYRGHTFKWDTVIEEKTVEFGRYLIGRANRLDFSEPLPSLHRADDQELRRRIVGLSQPEARRLGIPKGTLHYLCRKALCSKAFRTYGRTRMKLESLS